MNHKNYSINNYPLNFYVTYVLKLEGNKYYVGRAQNGKINKRIRQHLNGGGSVGLADTRQQTLLASMKAIKYHKSISLILYSRA